MPENPYEAPLSHRTWCRVVGALQRDAVDVMWSDGSTVCIPAKAIPVELRFPNAEFWLSWDASCQNYYVFLKEDDAKPVRR